MKYPWIPWFAKDWLTDKALTLCAPATRGVWMDLLMHMHLDGRVGSLEGTEEQLSSLSRCVPAVLALALTDLQTNKAADVTVRNKIITVTCRRLQREWRRRVCVNLRVQRHREKRSCNGVEPEPEPETEQQRARDSGFSDPPEWRDMAMAEAVRCQARNPQAYVVKILSDWKANGGPPKIPKGKPSPKKKERNVADYCEHCGGFVGRENRKKIVTLVGGDKISPTCQTCGKEIKLFNGETKDIRRQETSTAAAKRSQMPQDQLLAESCGFGRYVTKNRSWGICERSCYGRI